MNETMELGGGGGWAGRDGIICVSSGPRQGLDALRRWLDARMTSRRAVSHAGRGSRSLHQVIVVVPSRALAENLSRFLAADPLCSLGLSFMTLHGFARFVVQEAGEPEGDGAALDILVSRAVRALPELRERLAQYREVDSVVAQTVRDFLHAGLDRDNHGMIEAMRDVLAELSGQGVDASLAHAILDAALWVLEEADRRGIVLSQQLLARAAGLLKAMGRDGSGAGQSSKPRRRDEEGVDLFGLLPPCDAIVLYGFADVTGLGLDFLISLASAKPTTLFLDLPIDPADPETSGERLAQQGVQGLQTRSAWRFAQRFLDAMQGRITRRRQGRSLYWVGSREDSPRERVDALWKATDPHAEAAALAAQVRRLLDEGVQPEDIAVVFRGDSSMVLDLRSRFDALAVPYSAPGGAGFGPRDPFLRPLASLARMLRDGPQAPLDTWAHVSGADELAESGRMRRFLAGARQLGVARLSELRRLDDAFWDRVPQHLRLPLASLSREEGDTETGADVLDGDGGGLNREDLRAFLDRAAKAATWLERLEPDHGDGEVADREASWDLRLADFRDFLDEEIGWQDRAMAEGRGQRTGRSPLLVDAVMSLLRGLLPPSVPVTWAEFASLASSRLESGGRQDFGGLGGGVQVMSVTQARGCRFRYLFLPEMNQGHFPRQVSEDPLLPDNLRRPLRDILDSLPVKTDGHDEELYLFCQLLGAADHLVLSWHAAETGGQVAVRSPLLERLCSEEDDLELPPHLTLPHPAQESSPGRAQEDGYPGGERASPGTQDLALSDPAVPRTYRDLALGWVMARPLHGASTWEQNFLGPMELLLEAQGTRNLWPRDLEPGEVARARTRIFLELEGLGAPDSLGPYLGMVGPLDVGEDGGKPRRRSWWATDLEGYAQCPWQWFLKKVLRLEPVLDPMDVKLDWDPLMLGNAFHRTAEALVLRALAKGASPGFREPGTASGRPSVDGLVGREPLVLEQPSNEELQEMALQSSEWVLQEYGPSMLALVRPLAQEVVRRMHIFFDVDWAGGPPRVLGAEVLGEWRLDGGLSVRFKADRLDRVGDSLVLTDYKTGGTVFNAKKPKVHTQMQSARKGKLLQAVAYAGSRPGETWGRYLYVSPGVQGKRLHVVGCDRETSGDRPSGGNQEDIFLLDSRVVEETETMVRLSMATWEAGWALPNLFGRPDNSPCQYCKFQRVCARSVSGGASRMSAWHRRAPDKQPPSEFVSVVLKGESPKTASPESGRERS